MNANRFQPLVDNASQRDVRSLDESLSSRVELSKAPARFSRRKSDAVISDMARRTGQLGREIVEVVAFIDDLDHRSKAQLSVLSQARCNADDVVGANQLISENLHEMRGATGAVEKLVDASVTILQNNGQHSIEIIDQVVDITRHMDDVLDALQKVQKGNKSIRDIAKTVHLLAINARIEAARAGASGTGFATIASAINELAKTTSATVSAAQSSVEDLTKTIRKLSDGSQAARKNTDRVIVGNQEMTTAMGEISKAMHALSQQTTGMTDQVGNVQTANDAFKNAFGDMELSIADTTNRVSNIRNRTSHLVDQTESMVQDTVSLGAQTEDSPFIERVQKDAARVGTLFEDAIASGAISCGELFSREYTLIKGTNPEQVMAPFTAFTDEVLPPIQEAAFEQSQRVVFCAAVNLDGYLPTHNRKFSRPQSDDIAWNTGHCRNRRIFNDRVGLKAGQSTKPFLLQVYRRDMGGDVFKVMKDLSAPIMVNGRHWGGLRLAYEV